MESSGRPGGSQGHPARHGAGFCAAVSDFCASGRSSFFDVSCGPAGVFQREAPGCVGIGPVWRGDVFSLEAVLGIVMSLIGLSAIDFVDRFERK